MKISIRNSGVTGIVAGLGYLIQAIMGLIKPQTEIFSGTADYVLEAVFVVALLATIIGLLGFHSFAKSRYGKAGTVGSWLAIAGSGLMTISAIVTLFAGQNSLGPAFLGGMLLALIGYIILGSATLRTKVLPILGGAALILGFPLSVFLSSLGGGILFGLTWLWLGSFLMKQK